MSAETAFAVAAAAHAGFQLTVTVLVYPALVEVGPDLWDAAHDRHSRRIVPLVTVFYLALVVSGAALVRAGPSLPGWVGLAGCATALVVTAVAAAPVHARLGAETHALRRRLVRVDRLRCAAAILGASAAVLGAARACG